ncbi:YeiH family protein [Neptunomonas qingdaonensis]|nr:YeiH family protein [Neptunomonas qingdaonensis]
MSQLIALPLIAILAILLAKVPAIAQFGLSALPLAIMLGMVVGHVNTRVAVGKEITFICFCQQKLLRAGIILFGFSLSFQQIISVGWQAIVLDMLVITSVFCAGTYVGIRFFKLDKELAILTSVGSAICGAAAILATESVLKPRQQHVTVAVASVVLFGTLAMFSYPFIYQFSGMSEQAFGIYIGSTVHEVAQAVAAGEAVGGEALQNAVVVKLIRVMMLAPFIFILSAFLLRSSDRNSARTSGGGIAIPWFVFGFMAASGINSVLLLPEALLSTLQLASQFSLAIAMAALGVQTRWSIIRQAGAKPMVLSLMLFVMLIFGGFYLNQWLIVA